MYENVRDAGLGIAMMNGRDAVKQVAKRVTAHTNAEDGVAREARGITKGGDPPSKKTKSINAVVTRLIGWLFLEEENHEPFGFGGASAGACVGDADRARSAVETRCCRADMRRSSISAADVATAIFASQSASLRSSISWFAAASSRSCASPASTVSVSTSPRLLIHGSPQGIQLALPRRQVLGSTFRRVGPVFGYPLIYLSDPRRHRLELADRPMSPRPHPLDPRVAFPPPVAFSESGHFAGPELHRSQPLQLILATIGAPVPTARASSW